MPVASPVTSPVAWVAGRITRRTRSRIMQMPEAGRQIIYGAVIIGMLLVYGRGKKVTV
jgi:hypothetical protein